MRKSKTEGGKLKRGEVTEEGEGNEKGIGERK